PRLPRRRPAARADRGGFLSRLPELQGGRAALAAAGGQFVHGAGGPAEPARARVARLWTVVRRLPCARPPVLARRHPLPSLWPVPARRRAFALPGQRPGPAAPGIQARGRRAAAPTNDRPTAVHDADRLHQLCPADGADRDAPGSAGGAAMPAATEGRLSAG